MQSWINQEAPSIVHGPSC